MYAIKIKLSDCPDWVKLEIEKLDIEYPAISCLEWSDIEIFSVLYSIGYDQWITILKNNTNYENWIEVKTIAI